MKHITISTILLTTLIILSCSQINLSALSIYEVKEQVIYLKKLLAYDPGSPQGTEVTAQDIQNRKAEIQAEITALLHSTREEYSTYSISVEGYINAKGILTVKDRDSGITSRIKITKERGDAVTRNPGNFHLEAMRELDENWQWSYYAWVLKGSGEMFPEAEPEPINTIPEVAEIDTTQEPREDITLYTIAKDKPAQDAIKAFDTDYSDEDLDYFENTVTNTDNPRPEYYYWTAMKYISKGDPDTALLWLKLYLESGNTTYAESAAEYLQILSGQKQVFTSSSLPQAESYINSTFGERHFVVSPDGAYLYYSAYREENSNQLDIWRSERLNNSWAVPTRVADLSTSKDEALCAFSEDGKRAYLMGYYASGKQDLDIYSSDYKTSKWQKPVGIAPVNSPNQDIDPWVYDDVLMFFSSDRAGGLGGFDLYYSLYSNGAWQTPVNLGTSVNTTGNETAPFLDWDGKTLFFCSDGYPGLGGSDLYKVVILDSELKAISYPENLGTPINSQYNESRFFHSKNTNAAMIVSNRSRDRVSNIYSSDLVYADRGYYTKDTDGKLIWSKDTDNTSPLTGLNLTAQNQLLPDLLLQGQVTDDKGNSVKTTISVIYSIDNITYAKKPESSKSGFYEILLPRSDKYVIECSPLGYRHFSQTITPALTEETKTVDIHLETFAQGAALTFLDILFDPESSQLKVESHHILNEIALTLLNNPSYKVEIGGHTAANTYSQAKDLKLSQDRADNVVKYLIGKKVDPDRMTAKGYGKNYPVGDNKTDAGQRLNRRVVVKVIQ